MMARLLLAAPLLLAACTKNDAPPADTSAVTAESAAAVSAAPAPTAGQAAEGGFLDANSASVSELAGVHGLGDSIANAIVAARPFKSMTEVDKLLPKSFTEAQRDSVFTRLWTPVDLNTASGDEILLIPGVGKKMKHEFEEYRPYTSIEQFRREIGKYVDKEEVARLERYVTIRK